MIRKIIQSTKNALKGIHYAYTHDKSFRLEIIVGAPIYGFVCYLLYPLSYQDTLMLLFSYIFILVTELINTSIEVLLERLHPLRHNLIGAGKDVAAGAVFMSFVFAIFVVGALTFQAFVP